MRTIAAALLAAVISLGLVVSPAFAKGPTAATVEGPGIEGRHMVSPAGDYAELGRLTEITGFWNVFSDRGLAEEPPVPESELGPRYTVRWQMGSDWVTTFAYPFAATPALHLPDQAAAEFTGRARGGWTTSDAAVRGVFEAYGADASAATSTEPSASKDSKADSTAEEIVAVKSAGPATSSSSGGSAVAPYAVVGALLFLLLAGASVLLRRRGRALRVLARR